MRDAILVLSIAAIVGCGDEGEYEVSEQDARRYAELRCRAMEECCESPSVDCVERRRDALMGLQSRAPTSLTFSHQCMQDALSWVETLGCEDERDLDSSACELFHGQGRHGEPCFTFGDIGFHGSDCDEGLQCEDGVCLDDPLYLVEAPPGGLCDIQQGWICESDYFCSQSGICEPSANVGETCTEASQCLMLSTTYCAGLSEGEAGQCAIRPGLGEICAEPEACGFHRTESGSVALACVDGLCAALELGAAACRESLE
jgi:hypothetical protein